MVLFCIATVGMFYCIDVYIKRSAPVSMVLLRCEIFGFFSSRSLKMREKYISFAQFVYFLREVGLLFNFTKIE